MNIFEQRTQYSKYDDLKGCVIIWRGHFESKTGNTVHSYLASKKIPSSALFLEYIIYLNANKNSDMVYIHNAGSMGFPTPESFIKARRLVGGYLDVSGMNIPTHFNLIKHLDFRIDQKLDHRIDQKLDHRIDQKLDFRIDQKLDHRITHINVPHFPYTPFNPVVLPKDICVYLETEPAHQRIKYISVFIACILNNFTDENLFSKFSELINILEEYNIVLDKEEIANMARDGSYYLGYKLYSQQDLDNFDKMVIPNLYKTICFSSPTQIFTCVITPSGVNMPLRDKIDTGSYYIVDGLFQYETFIDYFFE